MRNLILLEQDIKDLELGIKELKKEINSILIKVPPSTIKEILISSSNINDDSILLKYVCLKTDLAVKEKLLVDLKNTINFYYILYKKSKNEDEMIFIEKRIRKYSNAKISVLHGGISRSTIHRKVLKVEKEMRKLFQKEKEIKDLIFDSATEVLEELKCNINN